jgi:molybdopterin synthase catalytic subunit
LVETEDEGVKMLSVDDYKEMKEKDLRKIIEEMKEDSDDDNPIQNADLDDDAVLAELLN